MLTCVMGCMQCASGWFSGSGASVCVACGAGKYLTKADGGTDPDSCTNVSAHVWCGVVWCAGLRSGVDM